MELEGLRAAPPKTNCCTGNRGRQMGDQGGCSFSGGVPGPGGSLGPPTTPPHPSHPRLGRAPSRAGVEAQLGRGARLGLAFQRIRFLWAGAAPLRPTPAGVWAWQMGVAGMGLDGHSRPSVRSQPQAGIQARGSEFLESEFPEMVSIPVCRWPARL